MEFDKQKFEEQKTKTENFYKTINKINCPYFDREVIFNSDGFHHLRYSARSERDKKEQTLKFNLLPLAVKIIKRSGTLQEYRPGLIIVGKKSQRDGLAPAKKVEYWGFVAICGKNKVKIRVVLRKIGDGNIIFWSVMPFGNISDQRLYTFGIEGE